MFKSSKILFRIRNSNILGIIRTQNRTQQILAGRLRIKNYSFTCNHNRTWASLILLKVINNSPSLKNENMTMADI